MAELEAVGVYFRNLENTLTALLVHRPSARDTTLFRPSNRSNCLKNSLDIIIWIMRN